MSDVVDCYSARRRGGRVAECGGLLNHPGLFRFSNFNHLQLGSNHLKKGKRALIRVSMLPALLPG
jgi:hypothetical protein